MQKRPWFLTLVLSLTASSLAASLPRAQELDAVRVKGVNCLPAGKGTDAQWLTPLGSLRLFTAYTEIGYELWATDGTTDGTYLVRDIAPHNSSDPTTLVAAGDSVFFGAFEGIERELWRSDGTEAGTVRVRAINPGNELTAIGSLVYFVADDGVHGVELWSSDGTGAGTNMVVDLEPGPDSARIAERVELDGVLSRRLGGSGSHFDLWRSDRTAAGTVPVMEFGANSNSSINRLTASGGDLYLVAATDGDRELWRHDPDTGQTVEIEVNPVSGSFPNELRSANPETRPSSSGRTSCSFRRKRPRSRSPEEY